MSLGIDAQIFLSPSPEVAHMGAFGFVNLVLALSILPMLVRPVLSSVVMGGYLLATLHAFSAMGGWASRHGVCLACGAGAALLITIGFFKGAAANARRAGDPGSNT